MEIKEQYKGSMLQAELALWKNKQKWKSLAKLTKERGRSQINKIRGKKVIL
jgi:hypothetical protein